MADDWQPGDLALCVKRGTWRHAATGHVNRNTPMRAGQIHTVRRYGHCPRTGHPTLWFEGFPGERGADGFGAIRFRKIRPLSDEEREESLREISPPVPVEA